VSTFRVGDKVTVGKSGIVPGTVIAVAGDEVWVEFTSDTDGAPYHHTYRAKGLVKVSSHNFKVGDTISRQFWLDDKYRNGGPTYGEPGYVDVVRITSIDGDWFDGVYVQGWSGPGCQYIGHSYAGNLTDKGDEAWQLEELQPERTKWEITTEYRTVYPGDVFVSAGNDAVLVAIQEHGGKRHVVVGKPVKLS